MLQTFCAALLVWLVALLHAPGARADALFATDAEPTLPLRIEVPLQRLLDVPKDEETEFPGTLTLEDGTAFSAMIRPRGKSRRELCSFPPLAVRFDEAPPVDSLFHEVETLFVVTHCSRRWADSGYQAAEFLAYRLLNVATPHSFRARALNITYIDAESGKQQSHHGFVVEHRDKLAERIRLPALNVERIEVAQLDPKAASLVAVFEYLLSNYDFSLAAGPEGEPCCHNAFLFEGGSGIVPIPYDFDMTGLVNPPYGGTPEGRLVSLTHRTFRGYCAHNEQLPEAVATYANLESDIMALIADFDAIPGLKRKRVENFVKRFYRTIKAPKRVHSSLIKDCR